MPRFLVECYTPSESTCVQPDGAHCVWSTFLPTDETALHLFEAASASALAEALGRAGLAYDRIVDAVELTSR